MTSDTTKKGWAFVALSLLVLFILVSPTTASNVSQEDQEQEESVWKSFEKQEFLTRTILDSNPLKKFGSAILSQLRSAPGSQDELDLVQKLRGNVNTITESSDRNKLLSEEELQKTRTKQCFQSFFPSDTLIVHNDFFFKPGGLPSVSILTVRFNTSSSSSSSSSSNEHANEEQRVLKNFHLPANFLSLLSDIASQAVVDQFKRLDDPEEDTEAKFFTSVQFSAADVLGTCCFVAEDAKTCQTFTIGPADQGLSLNTILETLVFKAEEDGLLQEQMGSLDSIKSLPEFRVFHDAALAAAKGLGELHGSTAVSIRPYTEFDDSFFVSEGFGEHSFSVGFRAALDRTISSFIEENPEKFDKKNLLTLLGFHDFFIGKMKEMALDGPNTFYFTSLSHADVSPHNIIWDAQQPSFITLIDNTKLAMSLKSLDFSSEAPFLAFDLATINAHSSFDFFFLKYFLAFQQPLLTDLWMEDFEDAYFDSFCGHLADNPFILEDVEEYFPDGQIVCGPNTDQLIDSFFSFFFVGLFNPEFLLANFT